MKTVLPFFIIFCLLTACNSQSSSEIAHRTDSAQKNSNGFAVVELFTSQGCSSCPPADALLSREIAAYHKAGEKLIALAFHVDYWNRLGWIDSFSQHQFTQRQYGYAAKLKGDGVYTPQAVVNGQQVLVGSKQAQLENEINKSLEENPTATLEILSTALKGTGVAVTYLYKGPNADLNIALVQNETVTQIKAGENEGRTLTSSNVVRSWKTIETVGGNNVVEIEMPPAIAFKTVDYRVVLFAQEKNFGKIVAADIK